MKFDNSGNGPICVPGFGLPLYYELPINERFLSSFDADKLRHDRMTPLELEMLRVMCNYTNSPNWSTDIFDVEKLAVWKQQVLGQNSVITSEAWAFCKQELQDKAKRYSTHGWLCNCS